jgi:putative transcriptional regulator
MEFFDYTDKNIEPRKGDILISDPFLADPNFVRTVILLCEHNDEGTFGFVLNKSAKIKLDDIIEDVEGTDLDVYIGGPVQQDTLHFIHRKGELLEGSMEVREGLFWGGDFDQLQFLLKEKIVSAEDFKFFIGYSGWSEGQLMDEMKLNSWIISRNVSLQQVFDTDERRLWKEVLHNMGGKFKMISNFPVDPRLN